MCVSFLYECDAKTHLAFDSYSYPVLEHIIIDNLLNI